MPMSDTELAARCGLSEEDLQRLRRLRGTSSRTLEFAPPAVMRKAARKLAFPETASQRLEHERLRLLGDGGKAPRGGLRKALQQVARMRRQRGRAQAVAGLPTEGAVNPLALVGAAPAAAAQDFLGGATAPALTATAGLAVQRWEWLGPGNIGGRTRSIVIHPTQPQRMLAGSAGGGVWFTENGGQRWDPVDDFMANLAVCCMAIDPSNANLVYAGTGEGFGNVDALRGAGIFRIVNGRQWQAIAATQGFESVNRIAVSRNGKTVLAATTAGLMRSIDAARAKWTRVVDAPMVDVKFHPSHSSKAVAASRDGRAWVTSNGGASWKEATHATPWSRRVELAYARQDPNTVYASVDSSHGGEFWRSRDGGRSYQRRQALDAANAGHVAPFLGGQGWYGNVVWAGDPTNADLVLVGGVNLWRSTDGGEHFSEITTWWDARSAHADHHAIVAHPQYDGVHNRCVFFGNDGGIFKAADIAVLGSEPEPPFVAGWEELNNNYGVTQLYGLAVHAGSGRVVVGAQDNGSLALQPGAGSEGWISWFGGDGGFCASDASNAKIFYGEYVTLNIHRNNDGATSDDPDRYISGQFWNPAKGPQGEWDWKPEPFQIVDARNEATLFIAPFAIDPANPQRLLGGGLSLWETTNARAANTPTSGPRWAAIKPSTGSEISAVAIAPTNSALLWVGHVDGAVFRSSNGLGGHPSWTRCGSSGSQRLKPQRMCTRILPHPSNPQVAYACFGGFVADNLWRTSDGGVNWTPLAQGLPAAPVNALAIHPRRKELLYAGTEVGLFASEDGGASWAATNEGPANVAINELVWAGQTLYAATHGRGAYRIDLSGV